MKYHKVWIQSDEAYVIPIGDIHMGDRNFTERSRTKLEGYIKWVYDRNNAKVILMGDLINCATRASASNPFEQNMNLEEQIEEVVKLFKPIKDKIVGAIDGNHELRLKDWCGYSPTQTICAMLGIPYLGLSAVINFQVGNKRPRHKKGPSPSDKKLRPVFNYYAYVHHTTGGGSTPGGKINRADKLRQLLLNADFYIGAHNHAIGAMPFEVTVINKINGSIEKLRQFIINSGAYLDWDESYAEQMQLPPTKMGSVRIRLEGREHIGKDVHISI